MTKTLRVLVCGLLTLLAVRLATAQTASSGTIQGHVVKQSGGTLRALIALRPAAGGAVHQGVTGVDGAFVFQNLPAGKYTFCARIPAEQASSANQPYLDTCMWEQPQNPVQLASGQAISGVQVAVPLGALLQVRVQDPGQVLAPTSAQQQAQALDQQIELIVRAPGQIGHRLPFVSSDSQGRNYALAVPAGSGLSLSATSAQANFFDASGQAVQAPVSVLAPTGSTLSPITLTLHSK